MRRRTLTVVLINRSCAEFQGERAFYLYEQLARRKPIKNARTGRWVTTPNRARDLVALAEERGYDVTVSGDIGDALW